MSENIHELKQITQFSGIGLVLHAQHVFANYFLCWYVAPLVSVITALYYVGNSIFHRRVWYWYRALSLRYVCIRSSGIIPFSWATYVPNFVSFASSIAELARGEKSRAHYSLTHSLSINQSINQSPRLFDVPGTKVCASGNFQPLTTCRQPMTHVIAL